jgi:hypothetical protein
MKPECLKHKPKGVCNIKDCENIRKFKSTCNDCGQKRYSGTCRSHRSNGVFIPRTHGKRTTKATKIRRKLANKKI